MNRNGIQMLKFFALFFATQVLYAESVWDKPTAGVSETLQITVYRSPTCGCCGKWLEHLKKHGFEITDIKTRDMTERKRQLGIPNQLGSCHTGIVNGYVIEGHVPAGDIKKLLLDNPEVIGLTVPAMPAGTPGMEMGGRKDPFAVISFNKDGKQQKFNEYLFY